MQTQHSDDEQSPRNSIDVLQEEENREGLLSRPQPMLGRFFTPRDPNQPGQIDKEEKKRWKRQNVRDNQDEHAFEAGEDRELLYEMIEGKDTEESPTRPPSISAIEASPGSSRRKPRPFTRRNRLRRLSCHAALFAILALLAGWLYLYLTKASGPPPKKIPAILRSNGTSNFAPTTILISLDGFRADFLQRGLTPTLKSLIEQGVSPEYMLPSFPSLTFPNHWTIMTGLHPESHGIVGNTFWDPALGEEFYYTDPLRSMQPKWWTSTGAEPLWSTCEKQGVRTAVHMWPGSEAGILPEPQTVDKYNGKEDLSKKVSRVFSFLDRASEFDKNDIAASEARPQFIAMYVPDVDAAGHRFGPNSTEIRATIHSVDTMLATLFAGIETRNLTSIVNVIVVSDHGMATTSTSRLIQLDDLLDPSALDHTDGWPLYGLRPKADVDKTKMYERLVLKCKGKKVTPYLRENMPERYHFSKSDRIAPIWLVPDAGYAIVPKSEFDVAAAIKNSANYYPHGLHGYDNQHPLMRAIFIARGPAFPHSPNSAVEVFQNIEVYNIVADSLGIEPISNNGSLRLPLKTTGIHSGHQEAVEDLPSPAKQEDPVSIGIDIPETVTNKPPETTASKSIATAFTSTTETVHSKPTETNISKPHNSDWIATVGEKLNDLKSWFKDLFDKFHEKIKGSG